MLMKMRIILKGLLLLVFTVGCSFRFMDGHKPVLYIIGDSTVKNGDGGVKSPFWGWGSFLFAYFDTSKISVRNQAIGGRSSRTFINEGRWERIMKELQPGDYVIMQFGHNDSGPLDDSARARGSIRGTGDESKDIYNPVRKEMETVNTYGAYLRKYVKDTQSKGAVPIICSPVPRNIFRDGQVLRSNNDYGKWAKEVALQQGVAFIDLNNMVADVYQQIGPDSVKTFFPGDHTHPNAQGSGLNAMMVVKGLRELKALNVKKLLKE